METIGTVTNAYRSGRDVVLTIARNPEVSYRRWKETMDAVEGAVRELSEEIEDMTCKECGERGNFTVHVKKRVNGKLSWVPVYLCGKHMNEFVLKGMHEQRKS